jgi:glycopeptide antibiotics resistance protein
MIDLNSWGRVLVSIIVVVGFMAILILILTQKLQGNATSEVLLVMLGALGAAFGQVVSYWVGSSAGSTAKDTAIKNLASKTP